MLLRGLVIIPYLNASYKWSSAFVSTSSGFFLSSGTLGICAIVLVQLFINTNIGFSKKSSIFKRLCISFLPAIREPLERSEGRHRQPFIFICSANDGPVSPRLCHKELSSTPYLIPPSFASASGIADSSSSHSCVRNLVPICPFVLCPRFGFR